MSKADKPFDATIVKTHVLGKDTDVYGASFIDSLEGVGYGMVRVVLVQADKTATAVLMQAEDAMELAHALKVFAQKALDLLYDTDSMYPKPPRLH